MKATFIIINTIGSIALLFLFLSILGAQEYAKIVFEGPLFFGEMIMILILPIGPILMLGLIAKDLKTEFPWIILTVFAILFALITYYTIPSVRLDRLEKKVFQVENDIEYFTNNLDAYKAEIEVEYYNDSMMELRTFYSIYNSQYTFLVRSKLFKIQRSFIPLFFGILSGLFFLNAMKLFFLPPNEK